MATQPIGPGPTASATNWHHGSSTWNRGYLLAGIRAGLIALVLLTFLIVIALL